MYVNVYESMAFKGHTTGLHKNKRSHHKYIMLIYYYNLALTNKLPWVALTIKQAVARLPLGGARAGRGRGPGAEPATEVTLLLLIFVQRTVGQQRNNRGETVAKEKKQRTATRTWTKPQRCSAFRQVRLTEWGFTFSSTFFKLTAASLSVTCCVFIVSAYK